MAGPITLKASAYPATSSNLEGVRELSSAEIRDHIAYVITNKFASDTDGTGTAELLVTTSTLSAGYDNIGDFTNRERDEAVGTHPATGAVSTTTYTFGQKNSVVSESVIRPLRWDGNEIEQSTDVEIDTEILDEVITALVTEDANVVGQYKIGTTSPSGGTWTARYTITETQTDGTDVTYYLWQKTAATTVPSSNTNRPLKSVSGSPAEMTDADIETLVPVFRNRIISEGVGTYRLTNGTPTDPGTWQQMGNTMTDQLKDVTSITYAGDYTGSYTGFYDRFFSGFLNGSYAGSYSGTYTGYYDGNTVQVTGSTQETKALFIRTS